MGKSGLEGFKEGLRKGNKNRQRDLSEATAKPKEETGDDDTEENMVEKIPTKKPKKKSTTKPKEETD
jgi:hypothetical protein